MDYGTVIGSGSYSYFSDFQGNKMKGFFFNFFRIAFLKCKLGLQFSKRMYIYYGSTGNKQENSEKHRFISILKTTEEKSWIWKQFRNSADPDPYQKLQIRNTVKSILLKLIKSKKCFQKPLEQQAYVH